MGDRVSIQFKNGKEVSVVLFSHWDGMHFVKQAKEYVKKLNQNEGTPLSRLEPQTVMVDFVREITKDLEVVDSNYYFGFDSNDGDNSDNGHHIINLLKSKK